MSRSLLGGRRRGECDSRAVGVIVPPRRTGNCASSFHNTRRGYLPLSQICRSHDSIEAHRMRFALCSLLLLAAGAGSATAQTSRNDDPVIRRMWDEGMNKSQAGALAQVLMDSIGPRLAGSPGFDAATAWLVATYAKWGVTARKERQRTWKGWRWGPVHADRISPRVQTHNAHLLAWSAGTRRPFEGAVIVLDAATRADFDRWVPTAKGKLGLTNPPEYMCRAKQELDKNATPETVAWVDS